MVVPPLPPKCGSSATRSWRSTPWAGHVSPTGTASTILSGSCATFGVARRTVFHRCRGMGRERFEVVDDARRASERHQFLGGVLHKVAGRASAHWCRLQLIYYKEWRIYDVTLENDRQIDEVGQPPKNDDRNEPLQDRETLFFFSGFGARMSQEVSKWFINGL